MLEPNQVLQLADKVKNQYPEAWRNCHREGHPENADYIILVGRECFTHDNQVGCNWKRGVEGQLSLDVVNYHGRVVDIVARAGAPDASLYWNDVTVFAPGKLVNPFDLKTHRQYNQKPDPTTTPVNTKPEWFDDLKATLLAIEKNQKLAHKFYGEFFQWDNNEFLYRHTAEVCTKLDILTQVLREK